MNTTEMNNFDDPRICPTVEDEMLDYLLVRYEGAEDAIENDEGVHVLGNMPNSLTFGWFFAGTRNEIYRDMRLNR